MADNELEPRQPGPPEPIQPAPPGQLDADQARQFEEFRKFQEFQKYREETGQLPPAPKKPLWQRALRSKLLRTLVVLLLIIGALTWAYQHYFGKKDSDDAVEAGGGGQYHTNRIVEADPEDLVRKVYDLIAQGAPAEACGRFEEAAKQQFASDFGAGSCEEAVQRINTKLNDKRSYSLPDLPQQSQVVPGATRLEMSSCPWGVRGGPRLGLFTVQQVELRQWIIVAHRTEACPAR